MPLVPTPQSASRALAALWSCDGGWEASALPVLSGAAALSLQVTLILGALVRGGLVPSPLSHVVTATALLTIALTRILYRIQLRVQSRVLGDVVGDPDAAEALVLSAKVRGEGHVMRGVGCWLPRRHCHCLCERPCLSPSIPHCPPPADPPWPQGGGGSAVIAAGRP